MGGAHTRACRELATLFAMSVVWLGGHVLASLFMERRWRRFHACRPHNTLPSPPTAPALPLTYTLRLTPPHTALCRRREAAGTHTAPRRSRKEGCYEAGLQTRMGSLLTCSPCAFHLIMVNRKKEGMAEPHTSLPKSFCCVLSAPKGTCAGRNAEGTEKDGKHETRAWLHTCLSHTLPCTPARTGHPEGRKRRGGRTM